ncbi:hypothetical protein G8V06_09325 [Clostridium botulinum D/C]|uniref:hypothetical protein n=1 Tax=Clostridium botulinum TaxID=1491 RepID=UPI001E5C918D|nr:hypothetical protein [Clostridium botulinum]MCD3234291.1 hypothetical protein [Clostridium botulinum D/C]MCD3240275.1 hypothetical protein [Clostridium botulinum D/C]MCD3267710.1 hypothetical protein [Clostridium botulinum D/C]MCD3306107.1 hypothetical protein [Clostridium botulinum D/C]MCD3314891.1 hypothetical protein [Clostridium botulinum D/C]
MQYIISDISKRILIVQGEKEVRRIKSLNKGTNIIKIQNLHDDIWKVELIYRVGDYFKY